MIRRNVELEARLIDDLLDLTRIAPRQARAAAPRGRPAADARAAARDGRARASLQKRLRLVTELAAEDHRVWADAPRLTQVFWNLLNNAVKFTPEDGTVTVRSAGEPRGRRGAWLVVEVSDTGIGIEPEAAAAHLRRLRAGRARDRAAVRRAGAGAGDQPGDRRAARRQPRGGEPGAGPGRDLHRPAARGRPCRSRTGDDAWLSRSRRPRSRRGADLAAHPPGGGPRRHRRSHGGAAARRSATRSRSPARWPPRWPPPAGRRRRRDRPGGERPRAAGRQRPGPHARARPPPRPARGSP